MNKFGVAVVVSMLSLGLVSCGGDDGGNAGPEQVRDFLEHANLDSSGFPWHSVSYPNGIANGKLKRWPGLVPIKFNGSRVAEEAADEIERRLKTTVFDRTSIADVEANDIEVGLIVSEYTSVNGHYQSTCGNVGYAPNEYSYPYHANFYNEQGEISTKLYVNIGSHNCKPRVDIAIHELGHALGLGNHFDGFGKGPVINDNFWKAMYTLYGNPIGTEKDQLQIIMSL